MFLEEDGRSKLPFTSHHIKGTDGQHDGTVDAEVGFVMLLQSEVIFLFPFPFCTFWKEVSMCGPCFRSGDLCFPPWRWSIYINYLEFCMGDMSLLPTYLFNHLFIKYGLLCVCFILRDIIQYCFICFAAQTVLALNTERSFSWLPSLWSPGFFSDMRYRLLFSLSQFRSRFLSLVIQGFLTVLKRVSLGYISCWKFIIFCLRQCSRMTVLHGKAQILPWAVATTLLSTVINTGGSAVWGVCGSASSCVISGESR